MLGNGSWCDLDRWHGCAENMRCLHMVLLELQADKGEKMKEAYVEYFRV